MKSIYKQCPDCNGTGTVRIRHIGISKSITCTTCNGKGSIKIKEPIKINKKKKQ